MKVMWLKKASPLHLYASNSPMYQHFPEHKLCNDFHTSEISQTTV